MLRQKLVADQTLALKNQDKEKLSALRYILAQIKNKEIEKNPPVGGELNDEEIVVVLRKIIKELNESIAAFKKGNRNDLVAESQKQLNFITPYLPAEISDADLKKEVEKVIDENKDAFAKNPKSAYGLVIARLKSKADPTRIVKMLQSIQK